ncbi:hypothetical protein B0J13DRAFT_666464 [Dactylonectria estremocensis]|uniref:Hemerythrin-like domain-containing protein n=1 Tax=Dactylonectria estremocensis TaxID=1079267 RepID=A0A9P9J601_9HYPO|nr:hypothetical protein B0J13DRAFT_666464 [Dactylonectria estremocensis]
MTETKVWVDTPFKLISSSKSGAELGKEPKGAQKLGCEMTIVHNNILCGLNAGSPKDKLEFANFAYAWAMVLKEHHCVEEERVFPLINSLAVPGLMDGDVAEHQEFHDGFEVYLEYTDKLRGGNEELDGDKLTSIIDSFGPVLREHLEHEIDTPLALEKYSDKTDEFPMTIILHDKTFDGGMWQHFPPILWRKDWWRFSGCDFTSQPQKLPFA